MKLESSKSTPGTEIVLFLCQRDPKRVRTAKITGWSGKAVAGPRSEIELIVERDEARKPGVYLLYGEDPGKEKPTLYVGQADTIGRRLRDHLGKEFWNQVVFFVEADLNSAHFQYLEGRLIDEAEAIGRCELDNRKSSGSRLDESSRHAMDDFLDRIFLLLPVLGIDSFVPISVGITSSGSQEELVCRIHEIEARGQRTPAGFVVLKGSQAVVKVRGSANQAPFVEKLRAELENGGVIVRNGEAFVFTRDQEFGSPSTAAAIIHGGSANGLIAWKNRDGMTLKQMESGEVEEPRKKSMTKVEKLADPN